MKKSFIYLRGLRHTSHTVFSVADGQKYYRDPQFGKSLAYSSGQQVKRSTLQSVLEALGEPEAPITFTKVIKEGNKLGEGEPWSPCDPSYVDQLLGGWMRAQKDTFVIKRRSPLSISAMHPLHPLLGGIEWPKENLTFDRSHNPERHKVRVVDEKGKELNEDEITEFIYKNERTLPARNFIQEQKRTSGLFVYDVAIDMRTLFCVATNQLEPQITPETIEKLEADGWKPSQNIFGKCLVCPAERREQIIQALAHGLINWRITTNQSRTFSPMETLAIAISNNANHIAGAIRAQLSEEEDNIAVPTVDDEAGATIYRSLPIEGYVRGQHGSANALEKAEQDIAKRLLAFDYENQL